jgi:MFS family permease
MPNSPVLWVAAGMLWIMDASINISMEPFRAFVGDMLPSEQRTTGFAMQSFFIGIGAVIASALPYIMTEWLGIANTAPEGQIPLSVKLSFYIGAAVFFLAVLWTVLRTREYSPEEMAEFAGKETGTDDKAHHPADEILPSERFMRSSFLWLVIGAVLSGLVFYYKLEAELYILGFGLIIFGLIQVLTSLLIRSGKDKNGFVVVINDLFKMPLTMKQLAVVQFFSWFALFAMWIYTTAGVTSTKYDMMLERDTFVSLEQSLETARVSSQASQWDNTAEVASDLEKMEERFEEGKQVVATMRVVQFFADEEKQEVLQLRQGITDRLKHIQKEYNQGADWVGVLMAVYNGFAAIMAFLLIWLARLTNRKTVHAISLLIGGLSLVSFLFIANPRMLMISELGIGLAWASILAMPYAILTGSLPQHKLGTYMGIFNFFIVIPQILAATILGFFVKHVADGQPIYALVLGGCSMFIASVLVLFVKDVDAPHNK